MGNSRLPGVIGLAGEDHDIDDGTMVRASSPDPRSVGMDPTWQSPLEQVLLSPAVRNTVQLSNDLTAPMTWDSFWRAAYGRADQALQAQANELLKRGNVSRAEYDALVKARNTLVAEFRKPLSPFGRAYSEILKSSARLPQPGELLTRKGSIEAVLESVGKSRASVNRLSLVFRVAGPALIVLDITVTTVVVMKAPADQRARTAAREYTGLGVGVAGGAGGAWAGCVTLAALGSPSLVVPVVGEVTEGGLCLVGGILGGLGVGWLGREAGKAAGESVYDYVTTFRWE